jgi:hypothetical protein
MRAALSLIILSACGGTGVPRPDGGGGDMAEPIMVASIELTVPDSQLCVGASAQITVTARDAAGNAVAFNGAITWSSSNTQVATVDNGTIHAVAFGSAAITGSYGALRGILNVTVIAPTVTVGPNPLTLTATSCPEQLVLVASSGKCTTSVPYQVRPFDNTVVVSAGSGTIPANGSATVNVQVNPQFVGNVPNLTSVTTSVIVDLPGTSLAVGVGFVDEKSLLGDWKGTWEASSTHTLADMSMQTVSGLGGTFTFTINGIDTTNNKVMGSIHWVGSDNYWTCNADNSMAMPMSFSVDRTFTIDSTNSTFKSAANMSCSGYPYEIDFRVDDIPPSPTPEYVLNFGTGFDPTTKTQFGSCGSTPQPSDACGFNGASSPSCKVTGTR